MFKTDLFPDENLFSKLCETIGDFNGVCMHLKHAFEVPQISNAPQDYENFAGYSFSSRVPLPGSSLGISACPELTNALRGKVAGNHQITSELFSPFLEV